VTVFTVGTTDSKRTIKEALAMGADRAVLVVAQYGTLDSLGTARVLAGAIKRAGGFEIVLCSEGSSDAYSGQVPPMLGELLSLPYVGYARKIEVKGNQATLEQSLEDSVRTIECSVPFVASVVSEINEPRYPTLIQIMQASKKPLEETVPSDLGPAGFSGGNVGVLSMSGKSVNRKRIILEGSPEETAEKLVAALAEEGLISK
jgi:electron transfer flavoprotein beta subunit